MSTPKDEDSTTQAKPSTEARTRRGSTIILTQDPNVEGGTLVPNEDAYQVSTPGTVIIAGPLVLPGLSFTLECRTLGTLKDSRQRPAAIDVSSLPRTAPPPDPLKPASPGAHPHFGEEPAPAGDGSDGQDGVAGEEGGAGGEIRLSVHEVTAGTNLPLSANGGQGGKGQGGQSGGTGGAGIAIRQRYEKSVYGGKGGKGGKGGDGGRGGKGGTIDIDCPAAFTASFIPSVKGGAGGSPAAGGDPGASGPGFGGDQFKGAPGDQGIPGKTGEPGKEGTINLPR